MPDQSDPTNPTGPTPGDDLAASTTASTTTTTTPATTGTWASMGLKIVHAADARVALGVALGALAADIGLRHRLNSLSAAVMLALLISALVVSGRLRSRGGAGLAVVALLFAIPLIFRSSDWLTPFNVLVALGALTMAARMARGGEVFNAGLPTWVLRFLSAWIHILMSVVFLVMPLFRYSARGASQWRRLLVGLLVIAPIFLVLLLLLASADSVFATVITFDIDFLDVIGHVMLLIIGALWVGGLLASASAEEARWYRGVTWRFGAVETVVGLAALVLLYVVFVATQVVVWLGGAQRILANNDITYADHARQGYFQLLTVAVLTIAVLLAQRAIIRTSDAKWYRVWQWLSFALVALTIVMLASALHRLAMYESAYGLTMLRLYSTVFAILLGAILVLLAGRVLGIGGSREWLPGASVALALVVLMGLNLANPEALVVGRNLARPSTAVPFDAAYAATLPDGLPVLANARERLTPQQLEDVQDELCFDYEYDYDSGFDSSFDYNDGYRPNAPIDYEPWYYFNLAEYNAEDAISVLCAGAKNPADNDPYKYSTPDYPSSPALLDTQGFVY